MRDGVPVVVAVAVLDKYCPQRERLIVIKEFDAPSPERLEEQPARAGERKLKIMVSEHQGQGPAAGHEPVERAPDLCRVIEDPGQLVSRQPVVVDKGAKSPGALFSEEVNKIASEDQMDILGAMPLAYGPLEKAHEVGASGRGAHLERWLIARGGRPT